MSEELRQPWDGIEDGDHVCSFPDCGRTGDDEGWPYLIYITVLTSPGEEGYAEITQCVCQQHFEVLRSGLMALGFVSHNHHGTQPFDDRDTCDGSRGCLTPAEYGHELIQP